MQKASYQQHMYTRAQVETANPGRILITLYDAAIRFVRLARQQINHGNVAAKGISLGRAYAIIAEFIHALDHSQAPELCDNLEQIYGWMLEQISDANLNMTSEPLEPVLTHLMDLRQTWSEAVVKATNENTSSTAAASR
ncbi:MAG: flagellar export chaperone FliS [Deltaproteobacteria bacterium]|nr:flagellar export chaperone FliS [Deltaproteobacteria bacterium]